MLNSSLCLDHIQQDVLNFQDGTALIQGAPGTGKSFLMLQCLIHVQNIGKIPSSQVLCLTSGLRFIQLFSKAQQANLFKDEEEALFAGNLHQFAFLFLSINQYLRPSQQIIDKATQGELISQILGYIAQDWEIERVVAYANRLREIRHNIPNELRRFQYADIRFEATAQAYLNELTNAEFLDYDDLLFCCFEQLIQDQTRNLHCRNYHWIGVDETQDMAPLALAIIEMLRAETNSTLLYFMDDGQSISSLHGATRQSLSQLILKENITHFQLPYDYRNAAATHEMLYTYAPYVGQIKEQTLATAHRTDSIEDCLTIASCIDSEEQNELMAAQARSLSEDNTNETTAILLRTPEEIYPVVEELNRHAIAHFVIHENDCFRSKTFKNFLQHIRKTLKTLSPDQVPQNPLSFIRWWKQVYSEYCIQEKQEKIINIEAIEQFLLQRLMEPSLYPTFSIHIHALLASTALISEAELWARGIISNPLLVMTTYQAKGLEFDNVMLHNATADVYPLFFLSDKSEDTRLLYVGMSRAKQRLFISYNIEPSYFLASPRVYNKFYDLPDIQKHLLIKMERRILEFEQVT